MKLLFNARIYTLDKTCPTASAVVVDQGRILKIGGKELLAEFDQAEQQDMQGQVIWPGLVDAHIHLQQYALGLQKINCDTRTKLECLHHVGEHTSKARPGDWIQGHGWNQNDWEELSLDGKAGWPVAADLDAIALDYPVYLTARSLHAAWVNTAALRLAGITAASPDPPNGKILRDAHGQPTGILLEEAMKLVSDVIPEPNPDDLAEMLKDVFLGFLRMGITGVHDFDKRTCFMALQRLHARGELCLRVVKNIPFEDLEHAAALGLYTGFGDDFLRIGGVKLFADGALGPHTAAMLQSYVDDPNNRGILILNAEDLFASGRLAAESGLGLAVHAIGDRANREVLNGFALLRAYEKEKRLPYLRHRIEHVQIIDPADASRLAEMDIVASMQPIHATSDMLMADRFWGKRAAFAYGLKTQKEHGVCCAFGSDAPVEPPNPFFGLYAAVTRQRADGSPGPGGWYPAQRLTLQEALEGFTLGPAYAAGLEDRLGQLSPGFLADLIVLKRDPFSCQPVELLELQPTATMVAGEWMFGS